MNNDNNNNDDACGRKRKKNRTIAFRARLKWKQQSKYGFSESSTMRYVTILLWIKNIFYSAYIIFPIISWSWNVIAQFVSANSILVYGFDTKNNNVEWKEKKNIFAQFENNGPFYNWQTINEWKRVLCAWYIYEYFPRWKKIWWSGNRMTHMLVNSKFSPLEHIAYVKNRFTYWFFFSSINSRKVIFDFSYSYINCWKNTVYCSVVV